MDRIWLYDATQHKTWVHPKVAERLEQWPERPKKTGGDGIVYIMTSWPCIAQPVLCSCVILAPTAEVDV